MNFCLSVAVALSASPVAASPLVIDNVRVEVGDGTTLEQVTVVVDGGRIRAVGGKPTTPPGARRIDGTGKVLSPGLFESLTQLGLTEVGLEQSTVDHPTGRDLAPAFRAAEGFNALSPRLPINRVGGVTRIVVSPTGGLLAGRGYAAALTGRFADGPRSDQPLAMFGSLGDSEEGRHRSRGNAWLELRRAFADVRLWAKHRADWEKAALRELSLGAADLEALLPVVEGKQLYVLYVERAADIRDALAFAAEEKIRLAIAGGAEAHLVAAELARAKVPVIVKPSEQMPSSFSSLHATDELAALLVKAGVQVAISSADWDQNIRRLRQEAGIAVAYGLSHSEAVKAITLAPAQIFGLERDLGSVSVGKRADLVLWSGDPLELSSVAELVIIDGEIQSLDNRQLDLARRYHRPAAATPAVRAGPDKPTAKTSPGATR